ncbi:hypothetical protein [Vulcanisaeta thermophila]|uniref:hypothetical protein n=1 Tax=Vulcanisaeta thermophila TaxID=867917 RepID=UPI000852A47B|nr:hypothetical protein [Vulcanisaeta thermophila]
MYYDEIQRMMDRASLYLLIAALIDLVSVITSAASVVLLSNNLPSQIAIKYYPILTFPGLNAVSGFTALTMVMALVGGFVIYMSRGSLLRREFITLPRMILTGIALTLIALLSSIGIFAIYYEYTGTALISSTSPLLPGTFSLIVTIALLVISLVLTTLGRSTATRLGRRYRPRTIRRQGPPPPPPPPPPQQ